MHEPAAHASGDRSHAVRLAQEGDVLFPGEAGEDEEPRLLCQVEQPTRRDTVRPDSVDPVGTHRREVGRDRRRRWVFAAVIIRAECPVRDAPEGKLPLPRPEEFSVRLRLLHCPFRLAVSVSRGRSARDPSRQVTWLPQRCKAVCAKRWPVG